MKKILLGVLVLVALGVVVAPFGCGIVMEKVVRQAYDDVNAMYAESGTDASVEIVEYDRGFRSSRIEWKVNLGTMASLYDIDEIIVVDQVAHGLMSVTATSNLEKNPWFTDFIENKLEGKNPLKITTRYSLSGNVHSTVLMDAFTYHEGEAALEIKPAKLTVECDEGIHNLETNMHWEGMSIAETMEVGTMTMSSELEKISTYIWAGDATFECERGQIFHEKETFGFAHMTGEYDLAYDEKAQRLSIAMAYGAETLLTGEEKIEDVFGRFALNKLDVDAYEEFARLYVATAEDLMDNLTAIEGDAEEAQRMLEAQMLQMGMQFTAVYEKFLKEGFEIQISDVKASLPQGKITGDVGVILKKDMTFAQFLPLLQQPERVLDVIDLQSDIAFPAELAGDDPTLTAPLYPGMQTGLFIKKGNEMVHKAQTKDGKLLLNGKEVVLN